MAEDSNPLPAETRAATSGSEVPQIEDAGRPEPNLVARLRARTIAVPKPGTEPFVPTQPFWVTSDCGPHAAGENAGLQYLPSYSTLDVFNAPTRVQAHVYVVEPLCKEAADALAEQAETIERLRAALTDIRDLPLMTLTIARSRATYALREADEPASPVSR